MPAYLRHIGAVNYHFTVHIQPRTIGRMLYQNLGTLPDAVFGAIGIGAGVVRYLKEISERSGVKARK